MRTIILVVVCLAIVGILTVDGIGMWAGHNAAAELAQNAAAEAAHVYLYSRSQSAARAAVDGMASAGQARILSAELHSGTTRWYEVTVSVQPDTHFLNHIPGVRGLLPQESTAVAHF